MVQTSRKNICKGLNTRLGLNGTNFELSENEYNEDGTFPIYITKNGGSPVIRFYWGYRAKKGTENDFVIPLRTEKGFSYRDIND